MIHGLAPILLVRPYFSLMHISLVEKDHAETARLLTVLDSGRVPLPDLATLPLYAELPALARVPEMAGVAEEMSEAPPADVTSPADPAGAGTSRPCSSCPCRPPCGRAPAC
jgi:hypothetical protein